MGEGLGSHHFLLEGTGDAAAKQEGENDAQNLKHNRNTGCCYHVIVN